MKTPSNGGGNESRFDLLETRVDRLEDDMRDVKAILMRLEPKLSDLDTFVRATLPHLATKAELVEMRSELKGDISGLRTEVNEKIINLQADMDNKITGLRTDMDSKITELKMDMDSKITDFKMDMNSRISSLETQLAGMPNKTYMWMVLGVLIAGIFGSAALFN